MFTRHQLTPVTSDNMVGGAWRRPRMKVYDYNQEFGGNYYQASSILFLFFLEFSLKASGFFCISQWVSSKLINSSFTLKVSIIKDFPQMGH